VRKKDRTCEEGGDERRRREFQAPDGPKSQCRSKASQSIASAILRPLETGPGTCTKAGARACGSLHGASVVRRCISQGQRRGRTVAKVDGDDGKDEEGGHLEGDSSEEDYEGGSVARRRQMKGEGHRAHCRIRSWADSRCSWRWRALLQLPE
jgi:hypothetical protein